MDDHRVDAWMYFLMGACLTLMVCAIVMQVRNCLQWRDEWAAVSSDNAEERVGLLARRPDGCALR